MKKSACNELAMLVLALHWLAALGAGAVARKRRLAPRMRPCRRTADAAFPL